MISPPHPHEPVDTGLTVSGTTGVELNVLPASDTPSNCAGDSPVLRCAAVGQPRLASTEVLVRARSSRTAPSRTRSASGSMDAYGRHRAIRQRPHPPTADAAVGADGRTVRKPAGGRRVPAWRSRHEPRGLARGTQKRGQYIISRPPGTAARSHPNTREAIGRPPPRWTRPAPAVI